MKGEVLHFLVVLFVEEMIGQMVENHRIGRIDGVVLGQHLNANSIGVGFVEIEFGNGQTDQSTDAIRIKLKGSLEGQSFKEKNWRK